MTMLILAGVVVIAAVAAVLRGVDVRLALLAAALTLAGMAGDIMAVVARFFTAFSDGKFIIPICSAMGFAYVLRQTGCDRDLVRVLSAPLRRGRFFLIPGAVAVGFLVNIPVISQTSTAVCVGAVLVPLLRAGGVSPVTCGASLVLGASVGGELLNPGAPELNSVAEALDGVEPGDVIRPLVPRLAVCVVASTLAFWWLSVRAERRWRETLTEPELNLPDPETRPNYLRALVPLLPIGLLFAAGPPLEWIDIDGWLKTQLLAEGEPARTFGARKIGLAMLIGVVCAGLAVPREVPKLAKTFFEGAGYGFTHIISLIVTALCFAEGVKLVGLAAALRGLMEGSPGLLWPLAVGLPAAFGWVSGSGMAATQGLFGFYVGPAEAAGVAPVDVGGMVPVAAAAGRTMSPVAAVVLMCASLTGTKPLDLIKRIALPLLIGLLALLICQLAHVFPASAFR